LIACVRWAACDTAVD